MISLHEIAKSINEDPRGVDNIDRSKGAEKKDQDADRVGRDDGETWMAPNGDYGGKYKGEIEYFDDEDSAKVYAKSGSTDSKGGEEKPEEPKGNIGKGEYERDSDAEDDDGDDAEDGFSDDTNLYDPNGPEDRDEIMKALLKDPKISAKLGDEPYWDDLDVVADDDEGETAVTLEPNMTLGDMKKQILGKDEPKGDEEPKKLSSDEIDKKVDDLGKEIFSIYHSGMSPQDQERYIDDLQKQIDDLKSQKESITINGKRYKPVKESKKHPLKEIYDRTFRSLK